MTTSPLGCWAELYSQRLQQPYDDPASYRWGAEFLRDCRQIEDWGCGYGWFGKTLAEYSSARVRNLDGSRSRFAHAVVDLRDYRSQVEGIFLRGVLEHNHDWPPILRNALCSFSRKMLLITFTPFSDITENRYDFHFPQGGTVPVLSLSHGELTAVLQSVPDVCCEVIRRETDTEFGAEHFFYLTRLQRHPVPGSLTMLCTTTGRATLPAMLDSLRRQSWEPGDEVLLVQDGPLTDFVRASWEAAKLPGLLIGLPEGPHGDCGESPRNKVLSSARGSYVVNLDDDDQLAPDGLDAVRAAIRSDPGAFFFFQIDLPDDRRFWEQPAVRWGNVGSSMFVAPTDAEPGTRGNFAGGDYYFILDTLARNPDRPVRWIDQSVFRIRPQTRVAA